MFSSSEAGKGINSYIVGCKSVDPCCCVVGKIELIVTQWDVNQMKEKIYNSAIYELIVTQWDVNKVTIPLKQAVQIELIVTQWDVNCVTAFLLPFFAGN